jgi:predicted XRE-type DNA-binding protein
MPADRSQKYRRLAAECLVLVRQASDLQVRAALVIMSQRWLEQAQLAEREALERSLRQRAI